MSDPVRVKGTTILPRLKYLDEHADADAREAVLERLGERSREQVKDGIMAGSWYPLGLFAELNRAIDRELGEGDLALVREMGRYAAEQVLTRVYPGFYRKGRPEFLFEKAKAVWGQFYSSGRLEIVKVGAGEYRFHVLDFAEPCKEHCLSVEGWVEGNLSFSGATDLEIREIACRLDGAPRCEFLARWQPPS